MFKNHERNYLELPEDSSLATVAYIRLLAYAAKKASGLGFKEKQYHEGEDKDTPGFSLEELRQDDLTKGIADDWAKELLPSICTVRCSINNTEVENPIPMQLTKYHRFVIKADEYMRYVTLMELVQMNKLLREAKDSGITAKKALCVSLLSLLGSSGKCVLWNQPTRA